MNDISLGEALLAIEREQEKLITTRGRCKSIHDLIDRFGPTPSENNMPGLMQRYSGYISDLAFLQMSIPLSFEIQEGWCEWPYRVVYLSKDELSIVTFCECDLNISTHERMVSLQLEIDHCNKCYIGDE